MSNITYQMEYKLRDGEAYTSYFGQAFLEDGSQRDIVIKILHPHITQDPVIISHLAGFLDVARGLMHPSLSPVWDFGRAGDYYFIIRDHLPGIPSHRLFQLVEEGRANLSAAMALYLAQEIVDAIVAIHRYRVPGEQPIYLYHGGLSPENIILTKSGGIVITDAGSDVIFWRDNSIAQHLRHTKGTYYPPEYLNGQRPMRRGDTYGVASLFYQMLAGQPLQKMIREHSAGSNKIPPIHKFNPKATKELDEILQQALHPELSKRMVKIKLFREALLKPGLIKQTNVRRREAMDYIEMLVGELAPEKRPTSDNLLFDYPFQLHSLLPDRPELPEPHERCKIPKDPPRVGPASHARKSRRSPELSRTMGYISGPANNNFGQISPINQTMGYLAGPEEEEATFNLTEAELVEEESQNESTVAVSLDEIKKFAKNSEKAQGPGKAQEKAPKPAKKSNEKTSEDILSSLPSAPMGGFSFEVKNTPSLGKVTESKTAQENGFLASFNDDDSYYELSEDDQADDEFNPEDTFMENIEELDVLDELDEEDIEEQTTGSHPSPLVINPTGINDVFKQESDSASMGTAETVAYPFEDLESLDPSRSYKSQGSLSTPETVALKTDQKLPGVPANPLDGLEDGQERFGKFVLMDRVALGGMAEVFRAKIEGLDGFQRLVAIKRILPEYSQDQHFVQMFKDEARIAGSLIHPNIVQIYELGENDSTYFISMEFIDGIDLARVIKIRRVLQQEIPLEIALSIGIAVCKATHYAHEACDPSGNPLNMIHRDVTPHNVLLSKKGEIKLADFGIAKASQNVSKTAIGELKGKLSYMSPEQAAGRTLDRRSDIFQIGILLYEMLTLKKMFEGNSDQSIMGKIQRADFPQLHSLRASLPGLLQQIVMKALAIDPNERYQNAQELEYELMNVQGQLQSPPDRYNVAPFTANIIEQRDRLLEQYNAARQQRGPQQRPPQQVLSPASHSPQPPSASQAPQLGALASQLPSQNSVETVGLVQSPLTPQSPSVSPPSPGFPSSAPSPSGFPSSAPASPFPGQSNIPGFSSAPAISAPISSSSFPSGGPTPPNQAHRHSGSFPPQSSAPRSTGPIPSNPWPEQVESSTSTEKKSPKILMLLVGAFLFLGLVVGGAAFMLRKPEVKPTALLNVQTVPAGARVQVDGQDIGKTPIFEKKIPFDKKEHVLYVSKPGHKGVQWSFRFKAPDDQANLSVKLRKRKKKRRFRKKRRRIKPKPRKKRRRGKRRRRKRRR